MKKYICLWILLLGIAIGVSAQNSVVVKGKVLNASNKLPINEVQISSADAASTVLTNEK